MTATQPTVFVTLIQIPETLKCEKRKKHISYHCLNMAVEQFQDRRDPCGLTEDS